MLTLKCVCTAANPCALEFAVYGSFFAHLVNKQENVKKKNCFFLSDLMIWGLLDGANFGFFFFGLGLLQLLLLFCVNVQIYLGDHCSPLLFKVFPTYVYII